MEIKFKDGLKKIKFYDRLLWIALISLLLFIVLFFSGLEDPSGWIFVLIILALGVSIFIFYIGMLYWMILTKNYLLLFLSILMGFITILFYFGRMRKKYFKEEKI